MLTKTKYIPDLAIKCLAKAKNDVTKATVLMHEMVISDLALYRELMDPLVREACYDAIRRQVRTERGIVWETRQPTSQESREVIRRLADGITKATLYYWSLPNGQRLGNATKPEVMSAAVFYNKQAGDMTVKAKWLELIAKRIKDGRTVKQSISEKKLADLRIEAGYVE